MKPLTPLRESDDATKMSSLVGIYANKIIKHLHRHHE